MEAVMQGGTAALSSATITGPLQAVSASINGLTPNQCVQTGAGGLLTVTGAACGSGGGSGGVTGGINNAAQYSLPYYSVAGTSNVVSGLIPGTSGQILTTAGSSSSPFWESTATFAPASGSGNYIQNTTSLQSAAVFFVSSGSVNGNLTDSGTIITNNFSSVGVFEDPANIIINRTSGVNGCLRWTDGTNKDWQMCNNTNDLRLGYGSVTGGMTDFLDLVTNGSFPVGSSVTVTGGAAFIANNISASTVSATSALFTNVTSGQCLQSGTGGQVTGTGSACGSGGGGGSGVTVYPATATASFPFGLSASTITVSTMTLESEILAGGIGESGTLLLHGANSIFAGDGGGNLLLLNGSINNVVYGPLSMGSPTTGNNNAVVGYDSLNGFGSSNGNIAIGSFVLNNNAVLQNVGVGFSALNTILGQNNVGIGYDSGLDLVAGSSNVFVGAGTAYGPDLSVTPTSGYGLTYIGYEAGQSTNTVLTNAVAIGYAAQVSSSNTGQIGGAAGTPTAMSVNAATMTASYMQVNGTGNGQDIFQINGSTYTALASSTTQTWTPGDSVIISSAGSTWGTLIDAGPSPSGNIVASPQYQVPFYSNPGTTNVLASSPNFTNNGTTVTFTGVNTIVESNVSSQVAVGVYFDYSASTIVFSSVTILSPGLARTSISGGVVYSSSFSLVNASSATGVTSYVPTNLSAQITPRTASSRIKISVSGQIAASGAVSAECDVNISTTGTVTTGLGKNPLAAATDVVVGVTGVGNGNFVWVDTPNTTSVLTYTVIIKAAGTTPTCTFNSGSGAGTASIFVEDIGPQ